MKRQLLKRLVITSASFLALTLTIAGILFYLYTGIYVRTKESYHLHQVPVSLFLFLAAEIIVIAAINKWCFSLFKEENRHLKLSALFKTDKLAQKLFAVGIILMMLSIGLSRVGYVTIESSGPYEDGLLSALNMALSDASETIDNNNTHTNQLVVLIPINYNIGNISQCGFYIKKENDTNWTKLQPLNNYSSGQVTLDNNQTDIRWGIGERIFLSEPTPDWMIKPERLYVKIIHTLSNSIIYEGSVYVS